MGMRIFVPIVGTRKKLSQSNVWLMPSKQRLRSIITVRRLSRQAKCQRFRELGWVHTKPFGTGHRCHGRSGSSPHLHAWVDGQAPSIETEGACPGADQLSRSRYCFTKSQPTSAM